YFDDPRQGFSLPLALAGTSFQRRVWQALCAIPPAETRSYGQLARELGSAPRALGGACRVNPVPIIVPCHRVLAANGLGGYGGASEGVRVALKRWLLEHEGHAL
ncbi:MAG: methylated-DNA--[protein]-cysteine S-methyltransferase, partial [Gammaproteobacteria bacterium]